jgi:hypothetical protein
MFWVAIYSCKNKSHGINTFEVKKKRERQEEELMWHFVKKKMCDTHIQPRGRTRATCEAPQRSHHWAKSPSTTFEVKLAVDDMGQMEHGSTETA